MLVLGLETSCDETSVAVVENGMRVQSCVIASSGKDFESVGGVIPEEAARKQLEVILPVIEKALNDAGATYSDLDAIAVTAGPGLIGSLLVGTMTARALSTIWDKPLIPVHHTLGHLSSTWLTNTDANIEPVFPIMTLSVSGGHSDLWYRTSHTQGRLVGSTKDDAAGEAFDKGAVLLGLPYPGGPALAKLAEGGNDTAYDFPLPLKQDTEVAFSFSGLKTSLKYLLQKLPSPPSEAIRKDVAASFQRAICLHLQDKLSRALELHPETKELHLVGGVSANICLRQTCQALADTHGIVLRYPETIRFCTDNGAMIAAAGAFLAQEQPDTIGRHFETSAVMNLQETLRPF